MSVALRMDDVAGQNFSCIYFGRVSWWGRTLNIQWAFRSSLLSVQCDVCSSDVFRPVRPDFLCGPKVSASLVGQLVKHFEPYFKTCFGLGTCILSLFFFFFSGMSDVHSRLRKYSVYVRIWELPQ